MTKIKKSDLWKNIVKGFIIAIIPILVLDGLVILSLGFFREFTYNIITNIVIYGSIGVIISIIYTYLSKKYPKFSNYTIRFIIAGYYLIYFIYLIGIIYLRDKII